MLKVRRFLFAKSIFDIAIVVPLLALLVPYMRKFNVSPMRPAAVAAARADECVSWNLINQGIWAVVETDDLAITSSMAPVPTSCAASGEKFPDPRKLSGELQQHPKPTTCLVGP